MSFKSVNELEKFNFEDCQITDISLGKDLELTLEALIIRGNNSQNSNYTDSYSDETKMVFEDAKILSVVEEGYSRYDADDRLIEEVKDRELPLSTINDLIPSLKLGYLFSVECETKTADEMVYVLEIDTGELNEAGLTDPTTPTYEVKLSFSKVTAIWEKYMNRVQK